MPRDRSEFDDLAPLIKLIRAHPPFDRETELVVTRKARKGDRRAQEKLVVHKLSLVISVARKFMGRGVRLEDLVQEGNYGLLKAIEHFDPEKGNRFSTYAVWWIRAYITRCLKDGPSAVRRTMPNGGLPPRDISLEETRSEEHTSELQSQSNLVCRLLLEKKKKKQKPDERHRHGPDHHPASWLLDLPRLEVPPRQCFEVGGVDAHGNVTSSGGARPSAASV